MSDSTEKEKILAMTAGGKKLALIINLLREMSKPGVNLLQIERKAWSLIEKAGGYPSFAKVPGYKYATCLNINEGVVHGIPFDYKLKDQDLLTIDIGLFYKGFHTDCARSFLVGAKKKNPVSDFLITGEKALERAIQSAIAGNRVGNISHTIEEVIVSKGFYPVRNYTGHGIGTELHQKPSIPCLLKGDIEKTAKLSYNMTIAIEVIYTMEKTQLAIVRDGWTVKTANNCPAACFEKTVAVGKNSAKILTSW